MWLLHHEVWECKHTHTHTHTTDTHKSYMYVDVCAFSMAHNPNSLLNYIFVQCNYSQERECSTKTLKWELHINVTVTYCLVQTITIPHCYILSRLVLTCICCRWWLVPGPVSPWRPPGDLCDRPGGGPCSPDCPNTLSPHETCQSAVPQPCMG